MPGTAICKANARSRAHLPVDLELEGELYLCDVNWKEKILSLRKFWILFGRAA